MVSESQKVILIEANETTGSPSASITWKLVEEKKHIGYSNQVYLKTDLLPYYGSQCWLLRSFDWRDVQVS